MGKLTRMNLEKLPSS